MLYLHPLCLLYHSYTTKTNLKKAEKKALPINSLDFYLWVVITANWRLHIKYQTPSHNPSIHVRAIPPFSEPIKTLTSPCCPCHQHPRVTCPPWWSWSHQDWGGRKCSADASLASQGVLCTGRSRHSWWWEAPPPSPQLIVQRDCHCPWH